MAARAVWHIGRMHSNETLCGARFESVDITRAPKCADCARASLSDTDGAVRVGRIPARAMNI